MLAPVCLPVCLLWFVLSSGVCGCSHIPKTIASPLPAPPVSLAEVSPGDQVEIELLSLHNTRYTTYSTTIQGTVAGLNSEQIELVSCRIEGRNSTHVPILSDLSYTKRYFSNTGIGVENAPEYSVPLNKIATLTQISTPSSQALDPK